MQRQPKRAFAYVPKPGRSELELIKKNVGKDGMFADPDFPVGPKALFADGQTPDGNDRILPFIFIQDLISILFRAYTIGYDSVASTIRICPSHC
jgi:hypothetical protein